MELSKVERLLLANQYLILSELDPSKADEYDKVREALENVYEAAYQDVLAWRMFDGLSTDECIFVQEVMDLYWTMQQSYKKLEDRAGVDEGRIVFFGFDGNHEAAYMKYARYLVQKEGSFTDLEVDSPDFNSHIDTLDRYRQRVDFWKSMGEKRELTSDDITAILEIRG